MTFRHDLLVLAGLGILGACTDSSDTTMPPPPPAAQHLYVGDDNSTGSLRSYALPLTSGSSPVAAVPLNKAFTIGVNSTTLAVSLLNDSLYFFTLPLTSTSTPYARIAAGSDDTPLFVSSGYLYQGGSGNINVYYPPFTSASAPATIIPTAGLSPSDLALDPSGNVYETTGGNSIGVVSGSALVTTFTAPTGTQFRGMAASATQLLVCGFLASSNNVYVYNLPLTTAATPAATIAIGTGAPEGCAVDASGNLYVGTSSGSISVFAPPFSNSSTPTLTLATTATIFGMTVGP